MKQLFLDCDGVLADFDTGFHKISGVEGQEFEDRHGAKEFWKLIESSKHYFEDLPLMEGAVELYKAVKHLRPIILTGCPRGDWAAHQKMRWRDNHFPGVPMVTCMSKDKVDYCQPGDILVDDFLKHSQKWIDGGGIFVHHQNTRDTIEQLKNMEINMPFLRLDVITKIKEEIRTTMYASLELDWNHTRTKRLLVERVDNGGFVDCTVRIIDLNEEEVAHCRALGIYDR